MTCYQFSSFHYDSASQKLTSPDGTVTQLRPKVGSLLQTLLQHYPEKCSRDELIQKVWLGNYGVGEKGLNQAIWSLRKVLQAQAEHEVVKTWPNQGYAIVGDVDVVQPAVHKPKRRIIHVAVALAISVFVLAVVVGYSVWPTKQVIEYQVSAFISGQDRQFNATQSQQGWITYLQESEKYTQLVLVKPGEQKRIRWQQDNIVAQAISPDGRLIAFMQHTGSRCNVYLLLFDSSLPPENIANCDGSDWPSLSWSQSGDMLLFPGIENGKSGIVRYLPGNKMQQQLFADAPITGQFGVFKPLLNADLNGITYIEHDQTSRYALTLWQEGEKRALHITDNPFDYCWDGDLQAFVIDQLDENGASLQWLTPQGVLIKKMAIPQRVERLDCSAQIYLTLQRKHFGIKAVDPKSGRYRTAIQMFDDSGYFHYQPGADFPLLVTLKGRKPQISRVTEDFKTQVLLDNQNWLNIAYPTLSPDSRKIVFQAFSTSGQASLYVLHRDTSLIRKLPLPTENFAAPQWSEDGAYILVSLQHGSRWHLHGIHAETGERQLIQEDSLYGAWFAGQFYRHSTLEPGVWLDNGQKPEKLIALPGNAWASWVVINDVIYSLELSDGHYEIFRSAISGGEKTLVTRLPKSDYVKWSRLSFWQGELIFTGLLSNDSDIYSLDEIQ